MTDELRDREDDIIWRIRWGKDWLYVYLLLEFQSSVDRFMAVRIMSHELCGTALLGPDPPEQTDAQRQAAACPAGGALQWRGTLAPGGAIDHVVEVETPFALPGIRH